MAGYQAVEWWRAWHGMATDPKWILVAKAANSAVTHRDVTPPNVTSVTPGHVSAIWLALCERASQSRPRGSVAGFDAEVLAASYGWDVALIVAVLDALKAKGLIRGDRLSAWGDRNPIAVDRTAKERKRRQRAAAQGKSPDDLPAVEPEGVTVGHGVTGRDTVTSRCVTTEREIDISLSRSTSSQDSSISTPHNHHDACASVGEIWKRLEAEGIPVGIIARAKSAKRIAGWIERGTTFGQLDGAIKRAKEARHDAEDPSPINVGFIDSFLISRNGGRARGFERGDSAVDRYVTSRGG